MHWGVHWNRHDTDFQLQAKLTGLHMKNDAYMKTKRAAKSSRATGHLGSLTLGRVWI